MTTRLFVTEALGHSSDGKPVQTKAPTCTESGELTYKCVCGIVFKVEEIPANGHTEKVIPSVAPTCTSSGLTEGKYCTVCDATIVKQEVVPSLGHSYEAVVTNPTCTADGYTTYTCSCGASYVSDKTAMIDHNYVDGYCSSCGVKEPFVPTYTGMTLSGAISTNALERFKQDRLIRVLFASNQNNNGNHNFTTRFRCA